MIDESDPCFKHLHRKEWATKECSRINHPGSDNPFSPCIAKLDPHIVQKSHIECLYDACSCDKGGDCECLCSALASFAEVCNSVGVPVKWRHQHKCPMQCEYGKEYLPCGPVCQTTCMDLSKNIKCEETGCVEGCFCPEGLVVNSEGKCVDRKECDCYEEDARYPPHAQIVKDCMLCECRNGSFDCFQNVTDCKKPCNNETQFTCADKSCVPKDYVCVSFQVLADF